MDVNSYFETYDVFNWSCYDERETNIIEATNVFRAAFS